MTLVEFLLARIAEDGLIRRRILDRAGFAKVVSRGEVEYVDPHAERLLAECEAKRRIVEFLTTAVEEQDSADVISAYDDAVRALALPYADHPDYDEAWRP